jgi:threonine dehydratase
MMGSAGRVTLDDVVRARQRLGAAVRRTPLEAVRWLGAERGQPTFFKLECWQTTGSFKLRGAMARLSTLSPGEAERGVLTASAGNHGLAVAHGAERLGLRATIVVPESASRAKVEAIRRYPVTLLQRGASYDAAERAARALAQQTGATFVSPYNDPEVIAGQGSVGLEILEDEPGLEAIVVPVGGGGLLAGVLVAAKALNPAVKVYGAEAEASPSMLRALQAGRIVAIAEAPTVADGLAGNIEPDSMTFPIIAELVDAIIPVSEAAIRQAVVRVARHEHLIIEGAAAVAVAALADRRLAGRRAAAVVTGRNIDLELFARLVAA